MTTDFTQPSAVALTIAGSDPSGGAGLQADLKTFQQLRVYGMSAVTLITVQNTRGVSRVDVLDPDLVLQQIEAVLDDIPPRAIKTGALGNARVVQEVGKILQQVKCPVVVDPVLVSKHGHSLADEDVVAAVAQYLLPVATVVTPNMFEIEKLVGRLPRTEADFCRASETLKTMGVPNCLIKAGEAEGQSSHWVGTPAGLRQILRPRLEANNTHGTGCVLSAALTARLALGECTVDEAIEFAIDKAFQAIAFNSRLGTGVHPAEVRAISS